MIKNPGRKAAAVDMRRLAECVDAFSLSSNVSCKAIDSNGKVLYDKQAGVLSCGFCRSVRAFMGKPCIKCCLNDPKLIREAERFGGRYIFNCESGFVHFASPFAISEDRRGALIGGPLLLADKSDYITYDLFSGTDADPALVGAVEQKFADIQVSTPEQVNQYSYLLFMVSGFLSGFEYHDLIDRQQLLTIQSVSPEPGQSPDAAQPPPYPLAKENELMEAITTGDRSNATRLLNEILGFVFFMTGSDMAVIRVRVVELVSLISRAAIHGGADAEQILDLNCRYLGEIDRFSNLEELSFYLTKIINQFTSIVFKMPNVKHVDVINKAINFIDKNYMKKITLREVAGTVFLSESYFSRIFKEEVSKNFNTYLNGVRIEKSKALLLSGNMDIVDICSAVGFEDQSYFCKVFKGTTGMTPGKFRESRGNTLLRTDLERR